MIAKCWCYGGDPECPFCRGAGVFEDSGPAPTGPGLLARRACGCAADWVGLEAHNTTQRLEQWDAQGFTREPMEWNDAAQLLTGTCLHLGQVAS